MTHWNILNRIFGDNTLDCGPQIFEKCIVIIELCFFVLVFPSLSFGPVGKVLNLCKFQDNSMYDTVQTSSPILESKSPRALNSSFLWWAQCTADVTQSPIVSILAKCCSFSSFVKRSNFSKILCDRDYVRTHDLLADRIGLTYSSNGSMAVVNFSKLSQSASVPVLISILSM